jgi:RNA polymerase sigma-70 factor, ECF subfamily
MLNEQDQERFMRLWAEAQPAVAAFVHAVVRDSAAAKDLAQETALVLFRRFGEYDGQRPFVAWALGVAKFQVLGFRRDEARSFVTFDTELFDKFTELWAEAAPAVDRRAEALQTCLERLAGRARQVVRLRYFEGLTAEEIGRQTGSNGAAIRMLLQRVREQLRQCIQKQASGEGRPA